jgi:hypothetical protein
VTSIGEFERGKLSGRVFSVVISEFGKDEPIAPIVLLVVYVESKEYFDILIDLFCLSISLRVISSEQVSFDLGKAVEFYSKLGSKWGTLV